MESRWRKGGREEGRDGRTVSEILMAYDQGPRGSACQSLELKS